MGSVCLRSSRRGRTSIQVDHCYTASCIISCQDGVLTRLPVDYPGQHTLPTLELIQKLNSTNGTFLPLEEIQGDIMYAFQDLKSSTVSLTYCRLRIGMRKPKEIFFFYSIQNPRKFKSVLAKWIYPHITSRVQSLFHDTSCF